MEEIINLIEKNPNNSVLGEKIRKVKNLPNSIKSLVDKTHNDYDLGEKIRYQFLTKH